MFSNRNRKHACFYRLIETLVKVWENSKKLWKHSPTACVPAAILVLLNFHFQLGVLLYFRSSQLLSHRQLTISQVAHISLAAYIPCHSAGNHFPHTATFSFLLHYSYPTYCSQCSLKLHSILLIIHRFILFYNRSKIHTSRLLILECL